MIQQIYSKFERGTTFDHFGVKKFHFDLYLFQESCFSARQIQQDCNDTAIKT